MKILANDGISDSGLLALKEAGFDVLTTRVAPEQLANFIARNGIEVLLVRSATQVDRKLIDACPSLRLIGRAGVGMDNIDVAYAKNKGLHVINTPSASSQSVAELVFAHLYGGVRFLYEANRNMPLDGDSNFKQLKKAYGGGKELRGKTLGIIGLGRIGQEVAKIALGIGMEVIYYDDHIKKHTLNLEFYDGRGIDFTLDVTPKHDVLKQADFITLHVPFQKEYVIGKSELKLMKPGVGIINTSRGGVLDEVALIEALDQGIISFAGLDVYESEPNPEIRILMHPNLSLSPHIGAGTTEAQDRIGTELAAQIKNLLPN